MRAEEKALLSLFEEGGRGEPRPPDLPGKRKPLNRGLTLLSFQGDEAFVSFPRPPRLGEALLLREGPRKLLLQVVWAKAEERGWVARAKVRGPWDGILPGWEAEIFPTSPPIPETPGPKIFLGRLAAGKYQFQAVQTLFGKNEGFSGNNNFITIVDTRTFRPLSSDEIRSLQRDLERSGRLHSG